jgi:hypothetical protein
MTPATRSNRIQRLVTTDGACVVGSPDLCLEYSGHVGSIGKSGPARKLPRTDLLGSMSTEVMMCAPERADRAWQKSQ